MTDRLGRFFINRLIRRQREAAIAGFTRKGIVERVKNDIGGGATAFRITATRNEIDQVLAAMGKQDRNTRGRSIPARRGSGTISPELLTKLSTEIDVDDPMFDEALAIAVAGDEGFWRSVDEAKSTGAPDVDPENAPWSKDETVAIVNSLRSSAGSPLADDVASMLLLAQAVAASGLSLDQTLLVLRDRRPIVTLISPVHGFVDRIGQLIRSGMVLQRSHDLLNAKDLQLGAGRSHSE